MVCARTPWQLRQLQFHCGKPPPAAVTNKRTNMGLYLKRTEPYHQKREGTPLQRSAMRSATCRSHGKGRPLAVALPPSFYSSTSRVPAYAVHSRLTPITSSVGLTHTGAVEDTWFSINCSCGFDSWLSTLMQRFPFCGLYTLQTVQTMQDVELKVKVCRFITTKTPGMRKFSGQE